MVSVEDPLYTTQVALEEESLRTGITQYRERTSRLREKGLESLSDPSTHLMRVYVEPTAAALRKWLSEMQQRPGRRAAAVSLLEQIDADIAALIALRTVLNGMFSAKSYQQVGVAVGKSIEDEIRFTAFEAQNKPLFDRIQNHIGESPLSYNPEYRRRVLIHSANKFRIVWEPWTAEQRLHVGSTLIDLLVENTGMVEVVKVSGRSFRQDRLVISPTAELTEWLDKQHSRCELLQPTLLPMMAPPAPWTSLRSGGYYTKALRYPLVRSRLQGIEPELAPEKMPAVYTAVNALQAVPYRVNERVLDVVMHLWDIGADIPKTAARVDSPLPAKPPDIAINAEARKKYKIDAREVFLDNRSERGRRLAASSALSIANRFRGVDLHFPMMLDFRGRMYVVPQYLSPQSSDLGRGLLTFRRGKRLGARGLYWLKVHIANTYGVDKIALDERAAWTDAHLALILRVAEDPLSFRWWADDEVDAPVQFLAACFELAEAMRLSNPEDFVSSLPILVDGSCNGIQHLAALSRDAEAGAQVNLVPSPHPNDIYGRVAEETVSCLSSLSASSSTSCSSATPLIRPETLAKAGLSLIEIVAGWVGFGIDRDITKRPTMILPYGGTRTAVESYIEDSVRKQIKGGVANPFGKNLRVPIAVLSRVVWDAMNRVVSGPRLMMDWTRELARTLSKAGHPLMWRTPSGFLVRQMRMETTGRRVKTKLGDRILKVTLVEGTDKIDSRRQSSALAPNWIHSLDAAALTLTIVAMLGREVTDLVAIHDSYGTHAADMDLLNETLRDVFVTMYREDLAEKFRQDISAPIGADKVPPPPAKGTLDIEAVRQSRYFFA